MSGKFSLWNLEVGTIGDFAAGETLGEEAILEKDKLVIRDPIYKTPIRTENCETAEESYV